MKVIVCSLLLLVGCGTVPSEFDDYTPTTKEEARLVQEHVQRELLLPDLARDRTREERTVELTQAARYLYCRPIQREVQPDANPYRTGRWRYVGETKWRDTMEQQ